jgi:hypothetical protein
MRDLALAESALRPALPDEIRLALMDLWSLDLDFPPAAWALALPLYVEALSDLPLDLLRESIRGWMRTSSKFPKPADLRGMVSEALDRRFAERDRLRAEARLLPAPAPRIEDPVQRAEMARRMGELARTVALSIAVEDGPRRPRAHYVEDCVPEEKSSI